MPAREHVVEMLQLQRVKRRDGAARIGSGGEPENDLCDEHVRGIRNTHQRLVKNQAACAKLRAKTDFDSLGLIRVCCFNADAVLLRS